MVVVCGKKEEGASDVDKQQWQQKTGTHVNGGRNSFMRNSDSTTAWLNLPWPAPTSTMYNGCDLSAFKRPPPGASRTSRIKPSMTLAYARPMKLVCVGGGGVEEAAVLRMAATTERE